MKNLQAELGTVGNNARAS